jgi:hypothetical protein
MRKTNDFKVHTSILPHILRAVRHEPVTVMMCNDWGELSSSRTSNTTIAPGYMKTVLRLYVCGCKYEIQFVAKTRCLTTVFRSLSLQRINVPYNGREPYNFNILPSISVCFFCSYLYTLQVRSFTVCVYLLASEFCKYVSINVTPVFAKMEVIKPFLFIPK